MSVRFEVIDEKIGESDSATYGQDYSVSSTDVVFASGVQQMAIPTFILNDLLPEKDETFIIRLTSQITGGATLGSITQTQVTIEKSDDYNGAFSMPSFLACLHFGGFSKFNLKDISRNLNLDLHVKYTNRAQVCMCLVQQNINKRQNSPKLTQTQ